MSLAETMKLIQYRVHGPMIKWWATSSQRINLLDEIANDDVVDKLTMEVKINLSMAGTLSFNDTK